MRTTTRMVMARAALIQSGEITHTHGHVIYPVSFRTIKTIVSSPAKPMPLLLDVLVSLIFTEL